MTPHPTSPASTTDRRGLEDLVLRHRPAALTWALLAGATVFTTWVLASDSFDRQWALIGLFAVAIWKVRLVMTDFMELRDAPLVGRVVFEGWAVAVPVTLVLLTWH